MKKQPTIAALQRYLGRADEVVELGEYVALIYLSPLRHRTTKKQLAQRRYKRDWQRRKRNQLKQKGLIG